jgi:hydroxypyruvate isomerase
MRGLAANLTMLFTDQPPLERPKAARRAGFKAVEMLFPYDFQIDEWAGALGDLSLVLINTPPGNWAAGDRGWAAIPGKEASFQASFALAADYAAALGATHIHVMTGNADGPDAEATLVENLRWAVARAPGQSLTLEPLNPIDMPGYFLNSFDQAARIIRKLGLPEVGLQLDFWHVLRTGKRMESVWQSYGSLVRHIQIAGLTDRSEPDAEAIASLAAIAPGYGGWVAAEYRPKGRTEDGLGWLSRAEQALTQG